MISRPCCDALQRCLSPSLFRALADDSRLALVARLAGRGEQTVSQLTEAWPVDLSVISRHLRTLRDAGVLEARREGKSVYYRIRFDALVSALRQLADALEACCPPSGKRSQLSGRSGSREKP